MRKLHFRFVAPLLVVTASVVAGCDETSDVPNSTSGRGDDASVVVYCSVDRAFAEPILADFEKQSGIRIYRQYDTEAGKTTGLVNKLIAERANPRADVWWSGEIFGTMQLAAAEILSPYRPTTAHDIPEQFRDRAGLWTAFGLRGRVIAYDPARIRKTDLPTRWADLIQPRYRGRIAMADPRFGTTRGHMATLCSLWGRDGLSHFLEGLRANEFRRADGNSHAVTLLTRGVVDLACTDTDDVIVARERGESVALCYPDLDAPDGTRPLPGTLWIPCSVALVRGSRHEAAARLLIDRIASAEIEKKLAACDSRNVPVREALLKELAPSGMDSPFARSFMTADATASGHPPPAFPKPGEVDYAAAAAALHESDQRVRDILLK